MLGFETERFGSLDGLDVSIDGVDIPLFSKSLNIFPIVISFVEFVTVMRVLNAALF